MKTVKFNFGIIALVVGLGLAFVTSAFKAAPAKTLETSWFEYDLLGDPTLPENYVKMTETPTCASEGDVCSINAVVDGEAPVIDSALETEINAAIADGSSSHPNVRLYE